MTKPSKNIAIVGAGMAAITCARTLVQAGHRVTVFEKSRGVGGRMSARNSPYGTFDHGAQYVGDYFFSDAGAGWEKIHPYPKSKTLA
jgi:predicted NAD/FAD-dependent oxidoreductase